MLSFTARCCRRAPAPPLPSMPPTRLASSASSPSPSPGLRVLVTGAHGMVGTALVAALRAPSADNHFNPTILTLVRRPPTSPSEVFWDPYAGRIDISALEGLDAVVHLAGENVGSGEGALAPLGRWSERKKFDIMESRRRGTALLSGALASVAAKPRVLVSASGVGFYGARCGDAVLREGAPRGGGFLAAVAEAWEGATERASAAGVRVVNLRFGVVLSSRGGVVAKLAPPFFMCLGGPIGSGQQWMSWITLEDAVRAIRHAMSCEALRGPVNACAPQPARNAEFAAALGAAMGRPALLPLPEPVVRAVFGEMGEETLLASQRGVPDKLLASGFFFKHSTIKEGCKAALLG